METARISRDQIVVRDPNQFTEAVVLPLLYGGALAAVIEPDGGTRPAENVNNLVALLRSVAPNGKKTSEALDKLDDGVSYLMSDQFDAGFALGAIFERFRLELVGYLDNRVEEAGRDGHVELAEWITGKQPRPFRVLAAS